MKRCSRYFERRWGYVRCASRETRGVHRSGPQPAVHGRVSVTNHAIRNDSTVRHCWGLPRHTHRQRCRQRDGNTRRPNGAWLGGRCFNHHWAGARATLSTARTGGTRVDDNGVVGVRLELCRCETSGRSHNRIPANKQTTKQNNKQRMWCHKDINTIFERLKMSAWKTQALTRARFTARDARERKARVLRVLCVLRPVSS